MKSSNNPQRAALLAGLICFLVYLPALHGGFVNLDDLDFVVNNQAIRHLDSNLVIWAFTKPRDLWIPFTWMSFALDYRLWGLNPFGYHLTNIVLHAANTMLVVHIADRLFTISNPSLRIRPDSNRLHPAVLILTGLLFGLHPLRVESVAWITERKDVLNGIFTFSSILWYLKYLQFRGSENSPTGTVRAYSVCYALYCCSLMAKPVSIVVPFLLLLADIYPLQRFRRESWLTIAMEKIPFLLPAVALSLLTLNLGARKEFLVPYDILPFTERIVVSGYALFEYVRLMIFPFGIAPFHAIPNPLTMACNLEALLAYAAIIACVIASWKRPWIGVVCGAFLLPFIPVLAFFQNGAQAFAARYTYLPALGICVASAFGITAMSRGADATVARWKIPVITSCCVALIVCYGIMTLRLTAVWKNTESLWTRVIDIQPVGRAYKERGLLYLSQGKSEAAIVDFNKALELDSAAGTPYLYNLFAFRGQAFTDAGRFEDAVKDFSAAIALFPDPTYYYHRGLALYALGRTHEAYDDVRRAGTDTGPITWQEH